MMNHQITKKGAGREGTSDKENPEEAENESRKHDCEHIPKFTKQELQAAINGLKKGSQETARELKQTTSKKATM